MCTAVEETNTEAIHAVINTTFFQASFQALFQALFKALFQLLVQTSYFHSDLWLNRENLVHNKQHRYRTRLVSSVEAVGQIFPFFTNFQTNFTFSCLCSNLLT